MMLGIYLKKYRISNNLTQRELANKIGIRQPLYSMIEHNTYKPGIKMLRRIANALNVEERLLRELY